MVCLDFNICWDKYCINWWYSMHWKINIVHWNYRILSVFCSTCLFLDHNLLLLSDICQWITWVILLYVNDWNDWQNQSFEKGKVWTYVSLYSIEDAWQNVSVIDIIALNINWNIKLFTYCILLKKYHILIYSRIHMFCLFVIGDLISF